VNVAFVALPILALLVFLLLLVEIRRYRSGRHLLSARRFALRIAAGALMMALLCAIFVGLFVLRLTSASGRVELFLIYWFGCIAMAFVLMFVMVADMRAVEAGYARRQHEIWRDFAHFIAGATKPSGPEEKAGPPEETSDERR
jgi:hypothetical protein